MARFLLIHGSWHGAWCWDRLAPLLEAEGHSAHTIDLPAHGDDMSAAWGATLPSYGRCVADAASALDGPPIAVGHSMGGVAISEAAAQRPDVFAGLVFLCAFVPRRGDSLMGLARHDRSSRVPGSWWPSLTGPRIRAGRARELFYGACREEDAAWATARLRPDPPRPLFQRLREAPPAALPRAYVECTEDRAISLDQQRAMSRAASIDRVVTLETDHSPFLSTPAELACQLSAIAGASSRSSTD